MWEQKYIQSVVEGHPNYFYLHQVAATSFFTTKNAATTISALALVTTLPYNVVAKTVNILNAAKMGVQATEGIYQFTAVSGKTYIGQSGNIAARLEEHIASGKLLPGTVVKTTEVLGGKTAREIAEQLRINSFGGIKYLENIRNPIRPARQYLLPKIP